MRLKALRVAWMLGSLLPLGCSLIAGFSKYHDAEGSDDTGNATGEGTAGSSDSSGSGLGGHDSGQNDTSIDNQDSGGASSGRNSGGTASTGGGASGGSSPVFLSCAQEGDVFNLMTNQDLADRGLASEYLVDKAEAPILVGAPEGAYLVAVVTGSGVTDQIVIRYIPRSGALGPMQTYTELNDIQGHISARLVQNELEVYGGSHNMLVKWTFGVAEETIAPPIENEHIDTTCDQQDLYVRLDSYALDLESRTLNYALVCKQYARECEGGVCGFAGSLCSDDTDCAKSPVDVDTYQLFVSPLPMIPVATGQNVGPAWSLTGYAFVDNAHIIMGDFTTQLRAGTLPDLKDPIDLSFAPSGVGYSGGVLAVEQGALIFGLQTEGEPEFAHDTYYAGKVPPTSFGQLNLSFSGATAIDEGTPLPYFPKRPTSGNGLVTVTGENFDGNENAMVLFDPTTGKQASPITLVYQAPSGSSLLHTHGVLMHQTERVVLVAWLEWDALKSEASYRAARFLCE